MTTVQKIQEIEAEMARTQKNKATNSHLGLLKARLAKLKAELLNAGSKGGGGGGDGFDVRASGNARVGLIGFPSVGKSTLMTKLTGAFSEAAGYEFTILRLPSSGCLMTSTSALLFKIFFGSNPVLFKQNCLIKSNILPLALLPVEKILCSEPPTHKA